MIEFEHNSQSLESELAFIIYSRMSKHMKTITYALASSILCTLSAAPVLAQGSGIDLPDIKAEIVQGWTRSDGKMVGALQISLDGGWKTYWRTPGDGGIPPRMDWSNSRNLDGIDALWPAPTVFVENGMTSYGFVDELLLPLVVTPRKSGRDVELTGFLQIGVCKEICIPYALDVSGALAAGETAIAAPIAAAMAERPFSAREARVSDVSCRIAPTDDGMMVSATIDMPSAGGREYAVIETGNPELWVQEATVSRSGGELTVASNVLHVEEAPFFLQRSDMTITVIGTDYAVEINGCQAG